MSTANVTLLERIPLTARVVLDVGCSTGALLGDYKRRNPRARTLGLEIDPVAAEAARGSLDDVVVIDVENDPYPFDDSPLDCIIFGDSLEHFADPWRVLARYAERLAPGGVVLICMPNLEHWSFVDRLLRGTFAYEPEGLFDRSHLRWFTEATTRQAITDAGLIPRDVVGRVFDQDGARTFAQNISPALLALGVDVEAYLRRSSPLQHVWRATKAELSPLTLLATMMAPVGGVSQVRVVEPLRALATEPAITAGIWGDDRLALEGGPEPKVFIFHRPAFTGPQDLEAVRQLLAAGYLVVSEFDDHPDYIESLKNKTLLSFSAVHAVQTTTEPLAQVLRQRNPEVAVFPNAAAEIPEPQNFANPNRISLFFGALNREADWAPYVDALNAVSKIAGDRLAFQIVYDQGLYDALESPHKAFTPLCDYQTYLRLLAHCEVSFMPLLDTPFNRCKSDLKALEASQMRVAALASPTVYGDWMEDGRTALLFENPYDLQRRLIRIVADPDYGRHIAEAARTHVAEKRMIAYQIAARTDWYRSLWARREDLTRALLSRVPELA